MLTVTLSVLQLREVLHPDILAKSIRPQVRVRILPCPVGSEMVGSEMVGMVGMTI